MAQSSARITAGLQLTGASVDIVHFESGSEFFQREDKSGGAVWRYPDSNDPEHLLNLAWIECTTFAAKRRWTHVVAFGGQLPLAAGPVYAAWLGLPLITLFRGNDFDLGIFSPRRRAILADAITRAEAVATVSGGTSEKIRALFPSTRVEFIPNGIDLSEWKAIDADGAAASEWRARRVDPRRLVIGMIGQLKRKKGARLLLDALAKSGCAERFHLLAIGECEDDLPAAAAAVPGLAHSFLPPQDRFALMPYFLACDFAAFPSLYDGMPNVLLEAGALGVPCLVSDAGGMTDVVKDREHGLVFEAGNADAAAAALRRAAAMSDEERRVLGGRLARVIAENHSAEAEKERYLHLIQGISIDTGGENEDESLDGHGVGDALCAAGMRRPRPGRG